MGSGLYHQLILDHNQHPKNFGTLNNCTHEAEGFNAICGDKLIIQAILDGNRIKKIRFSSQGCAISKAAASVMTESITGKTVTEVERIFDVFQASLISDKSIMSDKLQDDRLSTKLQAFVSVKQFPMRVKCVTLAWHTLMKALSLGSTKHEV